MKPVAHVFHNHEMHISHETYVKHVVESSAVISAR